MVLSSAGETRMMAAYEGTPSHLNRIGKFYLGAGLLSEIILWLVGVAGEVSGTLETGSVGAEKVLDTNVGTLSVECPVDCRLGVLHSPPDGIVIGVSPSMLGITPQVSRELERS